MPTYDPAQYDILEPVDYPVDLTRGMRDSGGGGASGEWPQIVTAIPKGFTFYPRNQFAIERTTSKGYDANGVSLGGIESASAALEFIYLYSGLTPQPGSKHIIPDGTGRMADILYYSETFAPGPNPSCSIYPPLNAYENYITNDATFFPGASKNG